MKVTFKSDRILLQSENKRESQAILAIHDLVFFGDCTTARRESIANDVGCRRFPSGNYFNYCSIPREKSQADAQRLCAQKKY